MTKEEMTKEEMTKEAMTKEEMTKEAMTKEEMNKKEMSKQEMNEEEMKKFFKQLNNDERLHFIENKVKCVAYEMLASVMWILGAIAVAFPPQNPIIIPISVLVIMGGLLISNNILYQWYLNDRLDVYSQPKMAPRLVIGIMIQLALVLLLVVRWITVGLSGVGIVYLAVLVIFIALSFVNLRNFKKYY